MPAQVFCSEVLNADELEIIHKNILVLKPKISCAGYSVLEKLREKHVKML